MADANPFLATPASFAISALAGVAALYNLCSAAYNFHKSSVKTLTTCANTVAKFLMLAWTIGYSYPDSMVFWVLYPSSQANDTIAQTSTKNYHNLQYVNNLTFCFSLTLEAVISLLMLRAFPVIRDSQKHKIGHIISLGIGALIVCYVVLAMLVDSPLGFWLKLGTTLLASWTAVMCSKLEHFICACCTHPE